MFLIKSKGMKLRLRDRGREGEPMLSVGPLKWVVFESLPKGHAVGEDVDAVIREVIDLSTFDGDIEGLPEPKADDTPNLDKMTRAEIAEYGKSVGLELDASGKKDELIEAVLSRLVEIDEG
jgi:hypothetical protein